MLDNILPLVKKPIRYTGGEYNIAHKPDAAISVGIVFPDVYEIGMSNLGIKIIYHLFNQEPDIQCERIFMAWPDFAGRMKSSGLQLFGLETKRPAPMFDLLGVSLQSELNYTNVLYLLDQCGIPARRDQRAENFPILLAGGSACLNPRPLSQVFDAFLVGDGEPAVPAISRILREVPRSRRDERIRALARVPGIWVPAVHGPDCRIKKQTIAELTDGGLPSPPILPICDVVHDRLTIEVMRGCTWGCRFCQSGYTNRPLRIRPAADILKAVEKGIRETGWEEVSLLSFSILDYPDLANLLRRLNEMLRKKSVSISLPAMRGELFSEELAVLLKEIKKTGLTFAPETASEFLRRRLNKNFSNDDLIASITTAYRLGWKQVKLYFMVGLPFETFSDIAEINHLVAEIASAYSRGHINLSVSPFIPKPHTPFEDISFPELGELQEKIQQIRKIKKPRVEIKYQTPETSFIEAVLSRADEKIYPVIEAVYRQGGYFEEWREGFDFSRWQRAFQETGIDPRSYLTRRDHYPWDFIDIGVSKNFLRAELERAQKAELTANCFRTDCTACGACTGTPVKRPVDQEPYLGYGRYPRRSGQPIRYRIKYSIAESFRYASHLDITRTIYRSLRRSDLPVQYTQGFAPIPRVSFCPPKSVGQIAKGDFFDLFLETDYSGNISRELNARFPAGIRILEVRSLPMTAASLSTVINILNYEVALAEAEIIKPIDSDFRGTVAIATKSGVRDLAASLESLQLTDGLLTCSLRIGPGAINIYDLLAYLTGRPAEEVRIYKVTRTSMFIKQDGILLSPMEVK